VFTTLNELSSLLVLTWNLCGGTLGMRRQVQDIFKLTPHDKQVLMFSATMSDNIYNICKKFMRKPREICVKDTAKLTLHGLLQYYVSLLEKEKISKLFSILDDIEFNQVIIFVKSPERAEMLTKVMNDGNFPAIAIHGNLPQPERIELFKQLKDFKIRILVTTNLFGRGIDVAKMNVVINFDMPSTADTYLHRVGRAGRFGTKGLAISFVSSSKEAETLNSVQNLFAVHIPVMPDKIDCSQYMTVAE